MGMTFTTDQQKVIDQRDKNLLVAAAAGSGKTAVLVARILDRITEKEDPVDIDQLLIVTFTRAAAAEMRERIARAIEERLRKNPSDAHLMRQQTLLYHAQITTIDSFCLYVVRTYFHRIDLEPDFRVAEEGERRLLEEEVLADVLDRFYEENSREFVRLTETLDTGKTDKRLKEAIEALCAYAMSAPWPKEWLDHCLKPYQCVSEKELEELPMYQEFLHSLHVVIGDWEERIREALRLSSEEDGPIAYCAVLEQEAEMLHAFAACSRFDEFRETIRGLSFQRLPAKKFTGDPAKKARVQELRTKVKDSVKDLSQRLFAGNLKDHWNLLCENEEVVRMLVTVTKAYMDELLSRKLERKMLDFSDIEHFALQILVEEETKEPTEAAGELRMQFREIMTDEYQDSNYVQEAILSAIARENNRFMVGDVKQSIYRFRMARPELFMEKYRRYPSEGAEKAEGAERAEGYDRKIDLHKNFRSRPQVLAAVNEIFERVMAENLGNVEYDDTASLYVGRSFEEEESSLFETEVIYTDPALWQEEEKAEAVLIAQKILSLMETQKVTDEESGKLRGVRYRDIVILLRSFGDFAGELTEVLKNFGIPAMTTTGTGYFSAMEVQTVLSYLRLIDNPRQDIPMAAILHSPIGGCSEEGLAAIRIRYPDLPFYSAALHYAKEEKNALGDKLEKVFSLLDSFRQRAEDTPVHELLYEVMDETGYLSYVSVLPGGTVRRANLLALQEKALSYEKSSYHGLSEFVRYMGELQKYEVDFSGAEEECHEDAVRIMTIHKSKGLEFPVVIAAQMGKRINQQDARNQMVLHPEYGIGLDVVDLKRRTRTPSLTRQILSAQIRQENLGEELRVLYVALTRAKEKLILTGTLKNAEKKMESWKLEEADEKGHLAFCVRSGAGTYFDWILPALLSHGGDGRQDSRSCRILAGMPQEILKQSFLRDEKRQWDKAELLARAKQADPIIQEAIASRMDFRYPYESDRDRKAKVTVTELKNRAVEQLRREETDSDYSFEEPEVIPYIPEFMREEQQKKEENLGVIRGTAMHRVLECYDFTRNPDSLAEQIAEMKEKGRLGDADLQLIPVDELAHFLKSPLAKRMQRAARAHLLTREKPFVMGKERENGNPEDLLLIQGMIDAFFEEDGQLVLVDYKTDAVAEEETLIERYRLQLSLYAEALEKATGKQVKEQLIYSFRLGRVVKV